MKFVASLSDPEIHTLTDMHRLHPSRRARMRAHSILLSHQGCSLRRIADIYQVSRYAVSAWLERWHTAGLVGLYDHPRSGRPPRLTREEQHKVDQYLQAVQPVSVAQAHTVDPTYGDYWSGQIDLGRTPPPSGSGVLGCRR